jgi:hypothetical protein
MRAAAFIRELPPAQQREVARLLLNPDPASARSLSRLVRFARLVRVVASVAGAASEIAHGVEIYQQAQAIIDQHLSELAELDAELERGPGTETAGGIPIERLLPELIAQSLIAARTSLNPANWDTSEFQERAIVLLLFGRTIWSRIQAADADTFLRNATQRLSVIYPSRTLYTDLAQAITTAMRRTTEAPIELSGDTIKNLTPLGFVELLVNYRLLSIRQPR